MAPGEFRSSSIVITTAIVSISNQSITVSGTNVTDAAVTITANSPLIVVSGTNITTGLVIPFWYSSFVVSGQNVTDAAVTLTANSPDIIVSGTNLTTAIITITANSPSITVSGTNVTTALVTITPTLNIDKLLSSCTVKRSLSDKMATATFVFDKTTVAGIYSSLFWTKLVLRVPDYAGHWNTIFVGIAPTSQTNFRHVASGATPLGTQSMKAYDYSWYLTAQTLEPENQVLLTWADQQLDKIYQLRYKDQIAAWVTGTRVIGYNSSDQGTIVDYSTADLTIDLKGYIGSTSYFTDSENLAVGYNGTYAFYAKADGHATDITGTPARIYPSDYIYKLLGEDTSGTKWAQVSGIYPHTIDSAATVWGSTIPEREFAFLPTTTKMQAIEEICQYMKWIFYVRYLDVSGVGAAIPCAFFVDEDDLDTTLDLLPSPVYVTSTTDYNAADARKYLVSPFTLDQVGENQYNWIEVRCQDFYGRWFVSREYTSDVYDPKFNSTGTAPKRPYYEVNPEISTQTDCTARKTALWTYYQKQVLTWSATFTMRSDFVLLQKLIISGYNPAIPDDDYRIIDIEYQYDNAGTRNEVKIKIIKDDDFKSYLNLKRVYTNSIFEIQNVVKNIMNKPLSVMTGTVVLRGGGGVYVDVVVDGQIDSVKRKARSNGGSFAVGDRVSLSYDSYGNLIATKLG